MFATNKKRQKPLELKAAVSKPGNFPKTALDVYLCTRFFADGSNSGDGYVLASSSADCNFF